MMQAIMLGLGFGGGKGFPEIKYAKNGNRMIQKRDKNGNLVYDEYGEPVYIEVDEDGNPIV